MSAHDFKVTVSSCKVSCILGRSFWNCLQAATDQADHPASDARPSKLYEDMEELLSPKAAPLNEVLAASPTAEGRLDASCLFSHRVSAGRQSHSA